MEVSWGTCNFRDVGCDFMNLNISEQSFGDPVGVYIIYNSFGVIRVGSGNIADRIAEHRRNEIITAYVNLEVTWAEVERDKMLGVEAFLADTYEPEVGDNFPNNPHIEVNLPF